MKSIKHASFVKSAGLLSGLTFVSRVLGLAREAVCAHYFGAGTIWDSFSIAFMIPNLSRRLFGEGALSAAFIPALSDKLHSTNRQHARYLMGKVTAVLAVFLLGITLVGEVAILASDALLPESLTMPLTAVMLPYMVFICLVAVLSGALNVIGRFGWPAFLPTLFNVLLILGVVIGGQRESGGLRHIYILSYVVLFAGITQLLIVWWALKREDFAPLWSWDFKDPDLLRIVRVFLPMAIGLAAVQLNTLADMLIAKWCVPQAGGVSALYWGSRLYQLPVGLFGAALATAIFPQLSMLFSQKNMSGFTSTFRQGIQLALFVGIPASVGLWAIRTPLIELIFQHGQFQESDTHRLAAVVGFYSVGIWAYILQQVLIRGYFSRGQSKLPMRVSTGMVVLNVTLNLVLVRWMGEGGIALATALSATLQVVLLACFYRLEAGAPDHLFQWVGTGKILLAAATMWVTLLLLEERLQWAGSLGQTALLVIAGASCYLAMTWVLRCRELHAWRGATGV